MADEQTPEQTDAEPGGEITTVEPTEPPSENYLVQEQLRRVPPLIARGVIYLVVAFLVVFLSYASFSSVDVITTTTGVVQPREGYLNLRAPRPGYVQSVPVRAGQQVTKDQPLIKMSTRLAPSGKPGAGPEKSSGSSPESAADTPPQSPATFWIRAPRDGTLVQIHTTQTGEYAARQDVVGSLIPSGAPLRVEMWIHNRAIGRLEEDMPVRYKFDAYPYREYGTVEGSLSWIAPAATRQRGQQYMFRAMGALEERTIHRKGRRYPIRPGMTVTVEIITGKQSLLSFLMGQI